MAETISDLTDFFEYLDDLRESGVTNMFGARPYLVRDHGLSGDRAGRVLRAWIGTFDGVSSPEYRAAKALAERDL